MSDLAEHSRAMAEMTALPSLVGVTLLRGTIADLDDVVALEQEAFTEPWTRAMFEGELSGNPFARFVIARASAAPAPNTASAASSASAEGPGTVIGYLCYWLVFEELRIMNIAIRSGWRRQGIATAMVQQAMREAIAVRGQRALLEVRASNAAALALYTRLGFRETGRRRAYYRRPEEDAVLMAVEPLCELTAAALALGTP